MPALLLRLLYRGLAYGLLPVLALVTQLRGPWTWREWGRFGERFGYVSPAIGDVIWVHAVSVGEVQAAGPLLRALASRYPGYALYLTATTVTGRARAEALYGKTVTLAYAPVDLPSVVRRFCRRVDPQLLIVLETELWPHLYFEIHRRKIPLIMASARLSARSARRYRLVAPLLRTMFAGQVLIAAQSAADQERFIRVGATRVQVPVVGNLKFDVELPADTASAAQQLRAQLGTDRPIWVAGSTHAVEEELVLDAQCVVRNRLDRALLVLAPRHPGRFDAVAGLLQRRGICFVRYSAREPVTDSVEVLLLDTVGDLMRFYASADLAFIGGSLVPIGGHNLLEPASLGLPMISGPHNANAAGVAALLSETGALCIVSDASSFGLQVMSWLQDPAERLRLGARARACVQENRGALLRLLGLLPKSLKRQV